MATEADVMSLKHQLEQANKKIGELQAENKVLKQSVDDEGVTAVQKKLMDDAKALQDREAEVAKREDAVTLKEKTSRVKELAAQYGVEAKELEKADDPEKKALQLAHEKLTKEKEGQKKEAEEKSPESVFESGNRGVAKKSVKDIDISTEEGRKEFQKYEAELKAKVPSK